MTNLYISPFFVYKYIFCSNFKHLWNKIVLIWFGISICCLCDWHSTMHLMSMLSRGLPLESLHCLRASLKPSHKLRSAWVVAQSRNCLTSKRQGPDWEGGSRDGSWKPFIKYRLDCYIFLITIKINALSTLKQTTLYWHFLSKTWSLICLVINSWLFKDTVNTH